VIVFTQAFHWCLDYDAAAAEFSRILKPGGVVALVWHIDDRYCNALLGDSALCDRFSTAKVLNGLLSCATAGFDMMKAFGSAYVSGDSSLKLNFITRISKHRRRKRGLTIFLVVWIS